VVLLLPKVNKDGAVDVVVATLLDVLLFAMLLKPAMLAVNELLVGAKVLDTKLNDLVVTCGNDVV
jgi:hypothetical protein